MWNRSVNWNASVRSEGAIGSLVTRLCSPRSGIYSQKLFVLHPLPPVHCREKLSPHRKFPQQQFPAWGGRAENTLTEFPRQNLRGERQNQEVLSHENRGKECCRKKAVNSRYVKSRYDVGFISWPQIIKDYFLMSTISWCLDLVTFGKSLIHVLIITYLKLLMKR